jgi:hypothetical protein
VWPCVLCVSVMKARNVCVGACSHIHIYKRLSLLGVCGNIDVYLSICPLTEIK